MEIKICIGSACHLKGSYDVIKKMTEVVHREQLDGKVKLKSSFCLGHCTNGVSVKVDNYPVESVTPQTAEKFLLDCIDQRG